jgi:hypothetical protein
LNDRLTEIGKYYRMERNVDKANVMIHSKQPSPVQIITDQNQLENVEYLNYLESMINDAR